MKVDRVQIRDTINRDKQIQRLILLEGSANLIVLVAKVVVESIKNPVGRSRYMLIRVLTRFMQF